MKANCQERVRERESNSLVKEEELNVMKACNQLKDERYEASLSYRPVIDKV